MVDGSAWSALSAGLDVHGPPAAPGTMLSSGNDAATALARVAGGTGASPATSPPCSRRPTGWVPATRSCATRAAWTLPARSPAPYDLALMARAALRRPATSRRSSPPSTPGSPARRSRARPGPRRPSTEADVVPDRQPQHAAVQLRRRDRREERLHRGRRLDGHRPPPPGTATRYVAHRPASAATAAGDRRPPLLDWAFTYGPGSARRTPGTRRASCPAAAPNPPVSRCGRDRGLSCRDRAPGR